METLKAITTIKRLRAERKTKVNAYKNQLDKVLNSDIYSDQYKNETERELNTELQLVRSEYDERIEEEIKAHTGKLQADFTRAEYDGLTEDMATKELLKEMRNQQQATSLAANHNRFNSELDPSFVEEVKNRVKHNLADAPAYINALEQIITENQVNPMGIVNVDELKQTYKNNNLNGLQKEIQKNIEHIAAQQEAWTTEKHEDVDPFASALLNNGNDNSYMAAAQALKESGNDGNN